MKRLSPPVPILQNGSRNAGCNDYPKPSRIIFFDWLRAEGLMVSFTAHAAPFHPYLLARILIAHIMLSRIDTLSAEPIARKQLVAYREDVSGEAFRNKNDSVQ